AVVHDLETADLSPSREISLVANQDARGRDTAAEPTHTETKSGTGTGAGVGATVGGVVGILTGLGIMAIPGIGPLVAAGWLATTLAGAGAGAVAGGLVGALTGAGVSREEAEVYEEGVRRGNTLVSVRADETDIPRIEAILDRRATTDWRARRDEYTAGGWQPTR
ncbi:MAG: hypothetical protein ACTHMA_01690, partial [Thermomicrobiales bacterium]